MVMTPSTIGDPYAAKPKRAPLVEAGPAILTPDPPQPVSVAAEVRKRASIEMISMFFLKLTHRNIFHKKKQLQNQMFFCGLATNLCGLL